VDYFHRWRDRSREVVGEFADIRQTLDFDYHGNYFLERQRFQDMIINDTIGGGTVHESPWIIFTAGAMGAGKGHTMEWMSAQGFFPLPDIVHVDPDKFRTELPEWRGYLERDKKSAGSMTHRESGLCVEIAQEAAMRKGKNVWIDGSLRDAEWYTQVFADIRKAHPGYRIAIFHVFADWELVVSRAESRAKSTGRIVPEADLRQSYEQVPRSVQVLCPYADFSAHISNDGSEPMLKTTCIGSACIANAIGEWTQIRARFASLAELRCTAHAKAYIENIIAERPVVVFSKTYCSYCKQTRRDLLDTTEKENILILELDTLTTNGCSSGFGAKGAAGVTVQLELQKFIGTKTVPQTFIGGKHVGGCEEVMEMKKNGVLASRIAEAVNCQKSVVAAAPEPNARSLPDQNGVEKTIEDRETKLAEAEKRLVEREAKVAAKEQRLEEWEARLAQRERELSRA